eukprot:2322226-Alexandrium_andersonii.AAC.1
MGAPATGQCGFLWIVTPLRPGSCAQGQMGVWLKAAPVHASALRGRRECSCACSAAPRTLGLRDQRRVAGL